MHTISIDVAIKGWVNCFLAHLANHNHIMVVLQTAY